MELNLKFCINLTTEVCAKHGLTRKIMKKTGFFKKGTVFCMTCAMIFSSAPVYVTGVQTQAEAANQDGIRKTETPFRDIPRHLTKTPVFQHRGSLFGQSASLINFF